MQKEISLNMQIKAKNAYYSSILTQEEKIKYESAEDWFEDLTEEEMEKFYDFEENFANNINNYTSEQLIQEIRKRGDLMIVGNWFTKEHIMDLCGANEMEATAFMGDCDPQENDAVLESAGIELQALFDNWQDENDQIIND